MTALRAFRIIVANILDFDVEKDIKRTGYSIERPVVELPSD
jgi:hypothetical protein